MLYREKIKITAKFRASRCLHFEDTKRIMSPELRPKSLRTFEKRAPGEASWSNKHKDKIMSFWQLFTLFVNGNGQVVR